jgi:cytoskeleton protein RodZ
VTGFGDKLRREREMRGVSLEEISESTKIGTRSLRALEQDDFEKLPGGIFNKGFVRAYSRFLGLDEEQTVADFDAAFKEYKLASGYTEEVQTEPEPEPPASKIPWLAITAIVLIAALVGAVYFVERKNHAQFFRSQPQSHPVSQEKMEASPSLPATTPPQSSANPAAASPVIQQSETSATLPVTPASSSTASARSDALAAGPAISSGDSVPPTSSDSSSPIRLKVFAREESWLSISADGKNLGQQLLAAQQSRTIRAQKEVRLKLGNVGGVEVSFNGKPVNIDGEPKQVKELTFTPDGLHQ